MNHEGPWRSSAATSPSRWLRSWLKESLQLLDRLAHFAKPRTNELRGSVDVVLLGGAEPLYVLPAKLYNDAHREARKFYNSLCWTEVLAARTWTVHPGPKKADRPPLGLHDDSCVCEAEDFSAADQCSA